MSIVLSPESHFDVPAATAPRASMDTVLAAVRTHHRRILAVAAAIAGIALLVFNRAMIAKSISAAASANPGWLAAAAATALLTVPCSAMCVVGASGRELPLGRTFAVELAGSFLNRIAPGGLGRAMLSVRYLTRHGLTPERAVSTVAIGSAVGVVAHIVAVTTAWSFASQSGGQMPSFVNPRILVAAAAVVTVAAVIGTGVLRARPHLADAARRRGADLIKDIIGLASDGRSSTRLIVGALAVRVMYVACFLVSLQAAGVTVDPALAALAYFAGTAIASAAPSPGGLGAAEVALAGTVMAIGVPADLAVAGVLIYRLATYWMLSLAGYVSWTTLRRRGIVS